LPPIHQSRAGWQGPAGHTEVLVHTGQHYDDGMSAVFVRKHVRCGSDLVIVKIGVLAVSR